MISKSRLSSLAHRGAWALLGLCFFLPLRRAYAANPASVTQADRLFQEGLELMRADQCPNAIERFSESQQLDPSAATLLNMANCYAHLGKTATAWQVFVKGAQSATQEDNSELLGQANIALAKLDPVLTRIRIVTPVTDSARTILVNGTPVRDDGRPIPVDPGETRVEASAPGREPWRTMLQAVGEGAVFVVNVPQLVWTRTQMIESKQPLDLRPAAMVVGGIGVVGLAVGVVWGLRAESAYNDSSTQGACNNHYCNQAAHDLRDTAFQRATLATWATVFGATAVATGTVLWFASPSNTNKEKPRMSLSPWVEPKQALSGLMVEGRL